MFIKLHEVMYCTTATGTKATEGHPFFVNPSFVSLVERSDIADSCESGQDRAIIHLHEFERNLKTVTRGCFESTSEVMEKIAESERRSP